MKEQTLARIAVKNSSIFEAGKMDEYKTNWLERAGRLVKKLATLVHLTAGAPARGTEYGPLLLRNTADQERSVYLMKYQYGYRFMFFQRYDKARSMTEKDRVTPRFAAIADTDLFSNVFALVNFVAQKFTLDEVKQKRLAQYAFAPEGDEHQSHDRTFASHSQKYLARKLNISNYRQAASAFLESHCFFDIESPTEAFGALQFGHTANTHSRNYNSTQPTRGITPQELDNYRQLSDNWQRTVGTGRTNESFSDVSTSDDDDGNDDGDETEADHENTFTNSTNEGNSDYEDDDDRENQKNDSDKDDGDDTGSFNDDDDDNSGNDDIVGNNSNDINSENQNYGSYENGDDTGSFIEDDDDNFGNDDIVGNTSNDINSENQNNGCEEEGDDDDVLMFADDDSNLLSSSSASTPSSAEPLPAAVEPSSAGISPPEDAAMSDITTLALRKVLGNPNADFKSQAQKDIVMETVRGVTDMIVIQKTGFGKSLCFLVPASVSIDSKATVVVVPLVALLEDLRIRATSARVTSTVWSESVDASEFWQHRIIFVSLENAVKPAFKNFIRLSKDRISRIVLDECHYYCSNTFRRNIEQLFTIRTIPVPLVLLSATVPVDMEFKLRQKFSMIAASKVFRSSTCRPELKYRVVMTESICDKVLEHIQGCSPTDKIIVFCPSKKIVKEVQDAALLDSIACDCVTGDLSREEKCRRVQRFKSQSINVMISTSALSYGIDISNINRVIHFGYTHSLIDYAQETGRAGRNGAPSICEVITNKSLLSTARSINTDGNQTSDILDFISNEKGYCRRAMLSLYLDGTATSCHCMRNAQLCDICERRGSSGALLPSSFAYTSTTSPTLSSALVNAPTSIVSSSQLTYTIQRDFENSIAMLNERLEEFKFSCIFKIASVKRFEGLNVNTKHVALKDCRCHPSFLWRGRCYKCGVMGCDFRTCPVKGLLEGLVRRSHLCAFCYLPEKCNGVQLHDEATWGSRSCKSPAKDRLLPLCLYIYHKEKKILDGLGGANRNDSVAAFVKWLLNVECGIPNAVRLFTKWRASIN